MKLTIFTTVTAPIARQDAWLEAIDSYLDLGDEVLVIIGDKDHIYSETALELVKRFKNDSRGSKLKTIFKEWPEEFDWRFIGQQFQFGYEKADGDWIIRADVDYIFHEQDHDRIRVMLEFMDRAPAASFWKYQFLLVDRYQIKSRPVCAMNKKVYGDRIKLDGGGDLCQPTLDGGLITSEMVPEVKCPIWNYDFCSKDMFVIKQDFQRFSRAWISTFENNWLGGPDEETAFAYFKEMMVGRFSGRGHKEIPLSAHPKYMKKLLTNLSPTKFGHHMFDWVDIIANYYKS